jgi:hypothetical protein
MPHITMVLQNTQEFDLTAVGNDSLGNEKPLFGPYVWTNSNPAVVAVAAVDSPTVVAKSVPDAVGVAVVTVDAFADAAQTKAVRGHVDIDVQAEGAVSITVMAGPPRPRT